MSKHTDINICYLNNVLIIILLLFIGIQIFIKPKQENLNNMSHLDIINRLISKPNAKNNKQEISKIFKELKDFTR